MTFTYFISYKILEQVSSVVILVFSASAELFLIVNVRITSSDASSESSDGVSMLIV